MKPKRFEEWAPKVFSSGPTIPYLDGIARWRLSYRTRERGLVGWKDYAIEMVQPSAEHCRAELHRQLRPHWNKLEIEVTHVEWVSSEQPVQTGREVKTVSENDYLESVENAKKKTEEERKELLREKGIWLPS